jgi:gamma-tubulin complex component 3
VCLVSANRQSLCHFLHHELSEYHRLLAVLESQMNLSDENTPPESGLTLIRLGLWTEDMRLKLRLMDSVVNDARSAHGGALVSKIHKHTAHGDPFVRRFTDQILEEVSKPFFLTLQRWIISGELHDPFNEFFVQPNPEITSDDVDAYAADLGFEEGLDSGGGTNDAHQVWEKRYIFVKAMMPGFINEDFGKKVSWCVLTLSLRQIFSTGRSLNFIRYNCYDSDWVSEQAALSRLEALKYSDLNGLERSIDVAYSKASKHLLEIFYEKYHLMEHLTALKSYLMLGAGDFVDLLMDSLSSRLDRPAISLYRHHLTSDLESAIRGSSAQFDPPDVLRRLDARVNEYSRGEIGWDCFALEYRVEAPLNAVLDARAMEGYARLFHHLWRLKRVETALTQGWMRVTAASRAFEGLPSLDGLWHSCRLAQAEMVHFLRNMQAFCQLEVIECSWAALREITDRRDGDLDALISAHRTYLDRVVRKILLLGPRKEDSLLRLVQEALSHILAFRAATEDLYKWSLGEATRLDRIRGAERGLSADDARAAESEGTASREKLESIRERVSSCSLGFQDTVGSVCKEAAAHAYLDVRFLAIRIAFNGHYSLRRGKKKVAA